MADRARAFIADPVAAEEADRQYFLLFSEILFSPISDYQRLLAVPNYSVTALQPLTKVWNANLRQR
jgi:hypothetical protein